MARSRRCLLSAASVLLGSLAVGVAPASAAGEPPCPAEEVGELFIARGFVATRSDGAFEHGIKYTDKVGNEHSDSFTYSVPPPARVVMEELQEGDSPYPRLDAPLPGPLPLTATWTQSPKSPRVAPAVCRATQTVVVPVLPVRVPAVRAEPAEQPVAIGPTLSWPCPDDTRTSSGPAAFVVRYERGLAKAPGPGSPSATVSTDSPCELNKGRDKTVPGVLSMGVSRFRRERSRKALAIFPARATDLRVSIEVRWGAVEAFRHDYAIVSAGRRTEEDGKRTPVFLTTEPAAAGAAARRFARERRGAAYTSPEQRAARRPREYAFAVKGTWSTAWAGGLGSPGDPGCYFLREAGADRATFSSPAFDPAAGGGLNGRIDRSYSETRECALAFKPPAISCPQRAALDGSVSGAVVPAGGLTLEGRRAARPTLTLGLFAQLGGSFCTGWGGLLPSAVLDGPAGRVPRLGVGRKTTVRLARTLDCRDAVVETRGEPTACSVRIAATVVVRRVR